MKIIHCNKCGREFCQRDYDANISVRWSHDTQANQGYQAELCCDCLEVLVNRHMEDIAAAPPPEDAVLPKDSAYPLASCKMCGGTYAYTHTYDWHWGGNAPKIYRESGGMCRACFEAKAARFADECTIKPKAVPWINLEMCAWLKGMEDKVNAHD